MLLEGNCSQKRGRKRCWQSQRVKGRNLSEHRETGNAGGRGTPGESAEWTETAHSLSQQAPPILGCFCLGQEWEGLRLKWSGGQSGVLQGLNWAPVQSGSAPRVTQSTLCPEGLKSEQATSTLLGKFN